MLTFEALIIKDKGKYYNWNQYKMIKKLLGVLQFAFFLAFGVWLFWLMYNRFDVTQAKSIILSNTNYRWIIFSIVISHLSHYIRALRWKMLIESAGEKASVKFALISVYIGYLSNLFIPRLGEVTKCTMLSRYEKSSFPKLIGTIITERTFDLLFLLAMTIFSFVLQRNNIAQFVTNHPELFAPIQKMAVSWQFYFTLFMVFALFWIALIGLKKSAHTKIKTLFASIWQGVIGVKQMKNKLKFGFYTSAIWILYMLMLYVCFFAFESTSDLTLRQGLFVFVMGSFGMIVPIQGGLGPWHFMTIAALTLLGIDAFSAKTFAFVVHITSTINLLICGLIALITIPLLKPKYFEKK